MIRRTLLLPEQLDQRLLIASRLAGKSVSDFVREALDALLVHHERTQTQQMYDVLDHLVGSGERGIIDASTMIDTLLYGEKGGWRDTRSTDDHA